MARAPRLLKGAAGVAVTVATILALLTVCALKGTSPGGAEEFAHYRRRPLPGDDPMARRLEDPSLEDVVKRLDHLDDN